MLILMVGDFVSVWLATGPDSAVSSGELGAFGFALVAHELHRAARARYVQRYSSDNGVASLLDVYRAERTAPAAG